MKSIAKTICPVRSILRALLFRSISASPYVIFWADTIYLSLHSLLQCLKLTALPKRFTARTSVTLQNYFLTTRHCIMTAIHFFSVSSWGKLLGEKCMRFCSVVVFDHVLIISVLPLLFCQMFSARWTIGDIIPLVTIAKKNTVMSVTTWPVSWRYNTYFGS